MRIHRFLSLLVAFVMFSRANAFFGYVEVQCLYTSTRDVIYMEKLYINKLLMAEYNSTLGNYTGYTAKMKDLTDEANKVKKFKERAKKNLDECKSNIPLVFDALTKPVEPTVKLKLVDVADSRHPSMLVCSAYGFYPKLIRVSWLRDGKETTTDVTSTEELSNGNWLYQIHSYLEFTPKPGEKISCRVEHASLMEPKLYDWEPVVEAERNKYAVGSAGLLLGLLFFITGLIFYKKNSTGRTLVPTSPPLHS
ncbi:rano class II histocompatibility antigen, A beta chain-like isoform X2 [Acanthochromis polyacanthus]|uniref:rano class II histocompatibility antigen, A beta chain-like isoform X2 n=1 Tax=Acanthochromis polyacanthus TaxID=80966 RepID=UPI0022345639|nr:rano class II histocompatibility antigen, A beta chain-like isoform X2 [Acanthochromis polyacanthus]